MNNVSHSDTMQWSRLLFEALDIDGSGQIKVTDIRQMMTNAGLLNGDPRIEQFYLYLAEIENSGRDTINGEEFEEVASHAGLILSRALRGGLVIPDFVAFTASLKSIFDEVLSNVSGDQADYIPPLKEVNPDHLGVSDRKSVV